MESATRVLLLEDDRADQFLFAKMLVRGGLEPYELSTIDRLGAFREAFGRFNPQVVVIDLFLPDTEGIETFQRVRSIVGATPIVVVTGMDDRELGLHAIAQGAQDFLVKGEFTPGALDRALRHAILRASVVRAAASAALTDPITELPTRLLVQDRMESSIRRAERHRERLGVLFLDLDGFKPVNDAYGHAVGDLLLHEVGQRLTRSLRQSDTVARWGGDEFVCVLERIASAEAALRIAALLHRKICSPIELTVDEVPREVSLGVSVGVAVYPESSGDGDGLLSAADAAMYAAKRAGGGCVLFGSEGMRALGGNARSGEVLRAAPSRESVRPLLRAIGGGRE